MTEKVLLQPAVLLHSRPYRDSSALLEFFTEDYGRISMIGRGVRSEKSRYRGLLRPFNQLLLSYVPRGELYTLSALEGAHTVSWLQGVILASGLYLNELLMRLLVRHDPYPALFKAYNEAIIAFQQAEIDLELALRRFEMVLLKQLGYGISWDKEAMGRQSILADAEYYFYPDQGFIRVDPLLVQSRQYSGAVLLAIAQEKFTSESLKVAKHILRRSLSFILESKPIHSRSLLLGVVDEKNN